MEQKVTLKISGLHRNAEAGDGNVETVTEAEYFQKGTSQYLFYEEALEGISAPVKNRIKFKDHLLELTRQGPIDTHMIFEEQKKHMSRYAMPYGEILLGIDTKKVEIHEETEGIRLTVEYALEMDGQHQADSRIEILIQKNEI